jgi:hypothetical protein
MRSESIVRFVNGIRVENDIADGNSLKSACLARYDAAATTHAREPAADLETRALGMLTDDQAMASFIRWFGARADAKVLPSLHTAADVSEYVNAIFAKVPS